MKKTIRTLATLALAAALGLGAPLAASATDTVDPRITAALAAVPGGELVDPRTAYWPDLSMTLSVPDTRLRDAIGSCANGSICAYSGASLTGAKLSWTNCSTYSTTALGSAVRSIANARSTGTLQARSGTTVVATAYAQSWASVSGTTDNVRCS